MKTVAVIGASAAREKFGNKCVRIYSSRGWKVYPVHPKEAEIEGVKAYPSIRDIPQASVDRISMYLPPKITMGLIEDIKRKNPGEIYLNPGAESPELIAAARAAGLNVVVACAIVAIGASPSEAGD